MDCYDNGCVLFNYILVIEKVFFDNIILKYSFIKVDIKVIIFKILGKLRVGFFLCIKILY